MPTRADIEAVRILADRVQKQSVTARELNAHGLHLTASVVRREAIYNAQLAEQIARRAYRRRAEANRRLTNFHRCIHTGGSQ